MIQIRKVDHEDDVQGTSVSVLADGYRRLAEELNIPICLTQVLIEDLMPVIMMIKITMTMTMRRMYL